jgi:hypothetical protein
MWGDLSVSDTDDDESEIYLVSDCCRIITHEFMMIAPSRNKEIILWVLPYELSDFLLYKHNWT